MVELDPLVERHPRRIGDVGLESLVSLEHGEELVADRARLGLDRVEPGKRGAIEELDRCEMRVVIDFRVRVVALLAPDEDVDRVPEAAQVLACESGKAALQPLIEESAEFLVVRVAKAASVQRRWPQVGMQPFGRTGDDRDRPVGPRRLVTPALALEEARPEH